MGARGEEKARLNTRYNLQASIRIFLSYFVKVCKFVD